MTTKKRKIELELINYPAEIVPIIQKRVRQLLPAFPLLDYDLSKLLASAYMQGVNDGLETIIHAEKTGQLIPMEEALKNNG